MIKAIHDTSNAMFRDPAGACRAGSSVCLTLLLERGLLHCDSGGAPALHLRFDKDGSVRSVPMALCPAFAGADLYEAWRAEVMIPAKGLYWYWFEIPGAADGSGHGADGGAGAVRIGLDPRTGQAAVSGESGDWQITAEEPAFADPDWIRGGVFYHVFVDRFARAGEPVCLEGKITRHDWGGEPHWRPDAHGEILNNDFFGGNLEGIRRKLPYFEELGVTCLYLSPIFEAYSSHKYDTSDYMKVDPMFGDEAGFTRLCEDARARGIRIICDGVFSHTGSDSRYFDIHDRYGDGACHHPDSPYRDWYYFEEDGWQSWWGIKTLPRVNKDIPSYQEFMAGPDGVIRHWLRAGASGWRLDVVDELPRTFLEKLTAAAKAEKPDAMMLGEVWEDASNKVAYDERKNYFEGNKLDSVMNYPLRRGLIDYVREGNAQALARPMQMILDHYPARVIHSLMNILGTHDTERIITALAGRKLGPDATRAEKASIRMDASEWAAGIRRLKTAVVLQMTLPGVPCIYYGDEAGMEGYNDPFNRRCFPWGHENAELQDWYRRVIAIRRGCPVYASGGYRLLAARDGLFAFERAGRDSAGDTCEVEMAGSDTTFAGGRPADAAEAAAHDAALRRVTAANCGQTLQTLHLFGRWEDLLSGAVFKDDVPVPPGQAMILRPGK
ncbi:MAG: glycoside hydrolase family 13 protein [Firmicutes bacterium]|nr:glycoside hydrolase family 13 protein [Bacillota bacterium]